MFLPQQDNKSKNLKYLGLVSLSFKEKKREKKCTRQVGEKKRSGGPEKPSKAHEGYLKVTSLNLAKTRYRT